MTDLYTQARETAHQQIREILLDSADDMTYPPSTKSVEEQREEMVQQAQKGFDQWTSRLQHGAAICKERGVSLIEGLDKADSHQTVVATAHAAKDTTRRNRHLSR